MTNLAPSRTKYRKLHKGRNTGPSKGNNSLSFGDFGIQSMGRFHMTSSQIEAARVALTRHLKRKGKVWMKVFPHKPITKKPAETRMGKGKGVVEYWVAIIKPGSLLFEVSGVSMSSAREAFRLADSKLPFKCRFISRNTIN